MTGIIDDVENLYDSVSDSYDHMYENAEHAAVVEAENMFLKQMMPSMNYGSVLDAGAGTGLFLDLFSDNVTSDQYLGIDISQKMLQQAKAKHPNYELQHQDFMQYPITNKFDTVISFFSISDYCGIKGLHKLKDHLNKDGMLICTFINSKGGYSAYCHGKAKTDVQTNTYSYDDLKIILNQMDFEWYYVLGFSNVMYNKSNSVEQIYQNMIMHKHNLNTPKYFYLIAQL